MKEKYSVYNYGVERIGGARQFPYLRCAIINWTVSSTDFVGRSLFEDEDSHGAAMGVKL